MPFSMHYYSIPPDTLPQMHFYTYFLWNLRLTVPTAMFLTSRFAKYYFSIYVKNAHRDSSITCLFGILSDFLAIYQVLGFGEYIEEVYAAYEQHKIETMVIHKKFHGPCFFISYANISV